MIDFDPSVRQALIAASSGLGRPIALNIAAAGTNGGAHYINDSGGGAL